MATADPLGPPTEGPDEEEEGPVTQRFPPPTVDPTLGSLEMKDATKCLRLDPRNNLPLVTVPSPFELTGDIDWNSSIVYWYGTVDRCTQWWRKERRVVFLGEEYLYVGFPGAMINRVLPIRGIKSVLVSHDQVWVNILMLEEHDLRFSCMEPCTGSREGKSVPAFLGALAILWGTYHNKAMPTYRMPATTNFKQMLNLSRSWRWSTPPVVPPRPRSALFSHLVIHQRGPNNPVPPFTNRGGGTTRRSTVQPTSGRGGYDDFDVPLSTVRPPVSAHAIGRETDTFVSGRDPYDALPLSARRPVVRAPFFNSPFTRATTSCTARSDPSDEVALRREQSELPQRTALEYEEGEEEEAAKAQTPPGRKRGKARSVPADDPLGDAEAQSTAPGPSRHVAKALEPAPPSPFDHDAAEAEARLPDSTFPATLPANEPPPSPPPDLDLLPPSDIPAPESPTPAPAPAPAKSRRPPRASPVVTTS